MLTNAGTVVWSGAGNFILSQSGVYNLAGSLFDMQNDLTISPNVGGEFFNNAGMLRKSSGSGWSTVGVWLDNSGTVDALSGIIKITGGGESGRHLCGGNRGGSAIQSWDIPAHQRQSESERTRLWFCSRAGT